LQRLCWYLACEIGSVLSDCFPYLSLQDDGGIEFFNTIVLQPHLKLVTDLGRGYHIRCRYKNREAAIKSTSFQHQTAAESGEEDEADGQKPQAYTSAEGKDRRDHGRSLSTG